MQKTIRHWWKKLKMIPTDGEIFHVLGLEESTLWKWLYYPLNLQIQCNPYQITNGIFYGARTNHPKICMETQKTPNSQSSLGGKKRSWRNQTPWLQTILQSYSNQDNMVLAQKQKHRSMEEDRKPRDKPTHLWSSNLGQGRQRYTMEKRQSLQ